MKNKAFCLIRFVLLCITLILCVQLLTTSADAANFKYLELAIIDSYTTGKAVDVTPYNLTRTELFDVFWDLRTSGRLPWYAERSYYVDYDTVTYQVYTFYPKMLSSGTYKRYLYEQKVQEIIDASTHDGMTQLQIALSVHDYLITHCTYDHSKKHNTGYDLVVHGTTMCNGYAEAYMDILNRLGIPCKLIESGAMNHGWNLVQLDGNWYHVDLTWDDPTPNSYGTAVHTYFLLTDEEMLAGGTNRHHSWETDITCTDTSYTSAFWKEVDSPICYLDSITFFVRRYKNGTDYIYMRDEKSGKETKIFSDPKTSINIGNGTRSYVYRGLSLWNNRLYFASLDTVYSCELDGSDKQTLFSYDAVGNQKYIYGILAENDSVYITFRDHERNTTSTDFPLDNTGKHIHSYASSVVAPTCLESGLTQYACACGFSFNTGSIPPSGHQYEQATPYPEDNLDKNTARFTCIHCGDSYLANIYIQNGSNWLNSALDWLIESNVIQYIIIVCLLGIIGFVFKKRKKANAE